MQKPSFFPLPDVCRAAGIKRSTVYKLGADGLFPQPIKCGTRSLWAQHEVYAVNAARLRGDSDSEIRQLVRDLVAARQNAGCEAAA